MFNPASRFDLCYVYCLNGSACECDLFHTNWKVKDFFMFTLIDFMSAAFKIAHEVKTAPQISILDISPGERNDFA